MNANKNKMSIRNVDNNSNWLIKSTHLEDKYKFINNEIFKYYLDYCITSK